MKSGEMFKILKTENLVIPGFLLNVYKKINLTEKELIFVSSVFYQDDLVFFDSEYLANNLNWSIEDIMDVISSLSEKNIINITVQKQNGKMKEYIDISNLKEKVFITLLGDAEEENAKESAIYGIIEAELGRTLSPIEYETIGDWINSNISEDLIKEALKEAVLNGVGNLKYIDKILHEWIKKGYKNVSDVRKKKSSNAKQEDLFEYDWLDEDV